MAQHGQLLKIYIMLTQAKLTLAGLHRFEWWMHESCNFYRYWHWQRGHILYSVWRNL